MNDKPETKRRWYQFSLRTMFVAVTLTSIPMAWVGYSMNWIRQRHQWINRGIGIETTPTTAPGGLWLLGEKGVNMIIVYKPAHDAVELHRLFPEARIVRKDGMYHFDVFTPSPGR